MLRTRSLEFSYSKQQSFLFPDVSCNRGEELLICGASGRGKTTFLHLLAGILRPAAGDIYLNNTNLSALSFKQLDRFRGENIGIVFQQSHFVQSLNALENVTIASSLAGKKSDSRRAKNLLEELNLSDKMYQQPSRLSLGQQQRVSIARALVKQPLLLLADEPTSSLDDKHCQMVATLLKSQAAAVNAMLVIVTHDQRLKAIFPKTIVLK